MWNIFEKDVCDCSASFKSIQAALDKIKLDESDIICEFNFFLDRYITDGITNEYFKKLNFRKSEDKFKIRVKSILEENNSTLKDKLLACTFIILRLRNNLFHGIKEMTGIVDQDKTFYFANQILKKIIDKFEVRVGCS